MIPPNSLFPAYPAAYRQWVEHVLPTLQNETPTAAIKAAQDLYANSGKTLKQLILNPKDMEQMSAGRGFEATFLHFPLLPKKAYMLMPPSLSSSAVGHELSHALVALNAPQTGKWSQIKQTLAKLVSTVPVQHFIIQVQEETASFSEKAASITTYHNEMEKHLGKKPTIDLMRVALEKHLTLLNTEADKLLHKLTQHKMSGSVEQAKRLLSDEIQAYGSGSLYEPSIQDSSLSLEERLNHDEKWVNAHAMAYRLLESAEARANASKPKV